MWYSRRLTVKLSMVWRCVDFRRPCTSSCSSEMVRVRFAPSPTGHLHLGSLRTIAYNYLFARSHPRGRFVLRIEDTDRERIVLGAVERLEEILEWLGIPPDESPSKGGPFAPYVQSQRLSDYQATADVLLKSKAAYRCFCTPERLMLMKKEALKNRESVRYDNRCRHLTSDEVERKIQAGQRFVVRLQLQKSPSKFVDHVFGEYEFRIDEHEGDPVILKSDGYPTYHLANVVDDRAMQITHVIRGEEWLQSTIKHLQLYAALDWKPPTFAHIPLLKAQKGGKLSKRDASSTVDFYRDAGYYPLALLNFVLCSGGGFDSTLKDKNRLYSLEELIAAFDLSKLLTKASRFEPSYLKMYNAECLHNAAIDSELVPDLRRLLKEKLKDEIATEILDDDYLKRLLQQVLLDNRIFTLHQLIEEPDYQFLWRNDPELHPDVRTTTAGIPPTQAIELLTNLVAEMDAYFGTRNNLIFSTEHTSTFLRDFAKQWKIENRLFFPYLRLLLLGQKQGLPVPEILTILGKQNAIERIQRAVQRLKRLSDNETAQLSN